MEGIVSITSQGQLTIPARIRRSLGLDKGGKAVVKIEDGKATVEPLKDFMDMAGKFQDRAIKDLDIDEIIERETDAAAKMAAKRANS